MQCIYFEMRPAARSVLIIFAAFAALVAERSIAAPLLVGDIVVAAQSSGSLYRVDPISGATSLISTGGLLYNPMHVVVDRQGRILNAERETLLAGIIRTDPTNGSQTRVASGPLLSYPTALSFDHSDNLIVGNSPTGGPRQLVQVNLHTGIQTLLSTLRGVSSVQDVDVDEQGRIVVLDFVGKIVRFDPTTGQQSTVSSGGNLFRPGDLLISPSGDFIVSNSLANSTTQILRIDSVTGVQQVALSVPSAGWITFDGQDSIVYADFNRSLSILRANLLTGQTETVTQFQFPRNLVGVAVYAPIPEPSGLCLSSFALTGLAVAGWRRFRQSLHSVAVLLMRFVAGSRWRRVSGN